MRKLQKLSEKADNFLIISRNNKTSTNRVKIPEKLLPKVVM